MSLEGSRLCIDFGSSFSKIALRKDWNVKTVLLKDKRTTEPEEQICVSSTVCEIRKARKSEWVCGPDALDLSQATDVIPHHNWKRHFIKPEDSPPPSQLAPASKFFTWLFKYTSEHPVFKDHMEAPIRVCLPDFRILGPWKSYFGSMLAQAGWNCPDDDFLENEPYTNLFGVLTCGRNDTRTEGGERIIRMGGIFDRKNVFLGRLQERLRDPKAGKDFGSVVIDVGAYTTDFGYLYQEDVGDVFEYPKIATQSSVLGIQQLDEQLIGSLTQPLEEPLTIRQREEMKRTLLQGKSYSLPSGRIVGNPEEIANVVALSEGFATRIISAFKSFVSRHTRRVDGAIMSGGGMNIPAIRTRVSKHLEDLGAKVVNFEADLIMMGDGTADEQSARNRLLTRGGSAVGGCSVYLDLKPRKSI